MTASNHDRSPHAKGALVLLAVSVLPVTALAAYSIDQYLQGSRGLYAGILIVVCLFALCGFILGEQPRRLLKLTRPVPAPLPVMAEDVNEPAQLAA